MEGEWENVSMGKWENVGDEEIHTMRGWKIEIDSK